MFSFYFDEGDDFDAYRDEVIRRVKALVDYADENGLICFEFDFTKGTTHTIKIQEIK